ncbi:MAG: inositol monophosphatase [Clostridia bacterium]|nr:inositol monophosphatase [Clostridia bacterium]
MRSRTVGHIRAKGAFDFVTEIDEAVDSLLSASLPALLPGSVVVSEEMSDRDWRFTRPTWIVDPVDGTSNLIYGAQESAVSIALVLDGQPAAGVVYNPFTGELYSAGAGCGARLCGEPIAPRPADTLAQSLVGFGTSPYDKRILMEDMELLRDVFTRCIDLRRGGSAALDLCHVACGRLAAFFERELRPWDYAAGIVILREAGARITTFSGGDPSLSRIDSILATNGRIHDEMLRLFAPYAHRHPAPAGED